jgi:hypothetical protein
VRFPHLAALICAIRFAHAGALIYDNTYSSLPPNVVSLGYQATGTSEFGDLIQFSAGSSRILTGATVVMSDWAYASQWGSTDPGYFESLTLNLYNVDSSSGTPQPGSLIASVTQAFLIPWRPEPDPSCSNESQWRASNGNCYNGLAIELQFNLDSIVVPDSIIYGLAYNTQTYGSSPYGVDGPYNSLNFGFNTTGPSIGSNPLPDTAYWNSTLNSSGTGFVQDTSWTPYSGAISFEAQTPEPATAGLFAVGISLVWVARRRHAKSTAPPA